MTPSARRDAVGVARWLRPSLRLQRLQHRFAPPALQPFQQSDEIRTPLGLQDLHDQFPACRIERAHHHDLPRLARSGDPPRHPARLRSRQSHAGGLDRGGWQAPLSLPAGSGIDPRLKRASHPSLLEQDLDLSDTQRSGVARGPIENERLVRINRSLHAAWRDAVRTPSADLRRRLRNALPASSEGVPVALDETTNLTVVPYEGGLPRPLAQCEVVAPCKYHTRTHPLSVISTNAERVHYLDHIVHAPAMTLEHLVDQYWFPAFGLLISPEGRTLAPLVPGPVSGRILVVDQGDRRPAAAGRQA